MEIKSIFDKVFHCYGRILKDFDTSDIINRMENTVIPKDVQYEASVQMLEKGSIKAEIQQRVFGELPIQIGYCNGHNSLLNAVEYHRSSEVNIAITDMILLVGKQQDIHSDYVYDTNKIEAFYVSKGSVVELYATTLHYAPCQCDESGFKCVVILPKGTNEELTNEHSNIEEDALLFACNKWLIAHIEANIEHAYIGLQGKNININE